MAKKNSNVLDKIIGTNNYTMNAFTVYCTNPETGKLIYVADVLQDSGLDITSEQTKVKGGSKNETIFVIPSSTEVSVTMTNITFSPEMISLASGSPLKLGKHNLFSKTDSLNVIDSTGTRTVELPTVPVGTHVYMVNGTNNIPIPIDTATPKTLDVTNYTDVNTKCVEIRYVEEVEAISLDINGDSKPSVFSLEMVKNIFSGSAGGVIGKFVVKIPAFQPDGNYSFTSALGANDTMALSGSAISVTTSDCGTSSTGLAQVIITNVDGFPIIDFSMDSKYELNIGDTDNIEVHGLLGDEMTFQSTNITSDCTFVSDTPSAVTVDPAGLITAVTATGAGTPAKITVTYEGKTIGTIEVEVI